MTLRTASHPDDSFAKAVEFATKLSEVTQSRLAGQSGGHKYLVIGKNGEVSTQEGLMGWWNRASVEKITKLSGVHLTTLSPVYISDKNKAETKSLTPEQEQLRDSAKESILNSLCFIEHKLKNPSTPSMVRKVYNFFVSLFSKKEIVLDSIKTKIDNQEITYLDPKKRANYSEKLEQVAEHNQRALILKEKFGDAKEFFLALLVGEKKISSEEYLRYRNMSLTQLTQSPVNKFKEFEQFKAGIAKNYGGDLKDFDKACQLQDLPQMRQGKS